MHGPGQLADGLLTFGDRSTNSHAGTYLNHPTTEQRLSEAEAVSISVELASAGAPQQTGSIWLFSMLCSSRSGRWCEINRSALSRRRSISAKPRMWPARPASAPAAPHPAVRLVDPEALLEGDRLSSTHPNSGWMIPLPQAPNKNEQ